MTDLADAVDRHKYRLPSGELAVNVTTVSGLLDDGKSGAFAGSAAKLTRAGVNYRDEWKKKAERGTRVHDVAEKFLRDEDADVHDTDVAHVEGVKRFIRDHNPQVIALEKIALSEQGYGGRFDWAVSLSGANWLLDLKTGHQSPVEPTLQLSAYRYADGIAVYDDEGTLTGLTPLPEFDHAGCLYVNDQGEYSIVEYPADRAAWENFCALLRVYKWTRSQQMKQLKKEAR